MHILVINCGSSSAKYQLFDVEKHASLARGVVERIGKDNAGLKHQRDGDVVKRKVACKDHYTAIDIIVATLTDPATGVLSAKEDIHGIGHRVVHGGEEFKASTLIDGRVIRSIEKFSELAPLHNPPSLEGIRACEKILKGVPQVAVFDTAFHQTMPATAYMYGLPYSFYTKHGIRKYGFHGTSHRFVSAEAARVLKRPLESLKMITCHLGNGCSMAAIDGGKSVDTTMGFTPLEGLLMGTRCGDLDPAAVLLIVERENVPLHDVNDILNKESGLLGISGVSNDMRDILEGAGGEGPGAKPSTAERCRLALDMFVYRIKKYIGAYYAVMGGLDAVVLTAGIGENNPWILKRLEKDLADVLPKKTQFLVVPTNEELLIARDTVSIIGESKQKETK